MAAQTKRGGVSAGARSLIRALLVGALLAAAIVFGVILLRGGDAQTRTLRATFDRTGNLLQGNPVRVAGVPVGLVKDLRIDPQSGGVTVTFEVPNDQPVYENAEARIRSVNLVGERYVDVVPGTPDAGPLPTADGTMIPVRGTVPISLDDFAGQLAPFVAGPFDRFLDEANTALDGRSQQLKGTIRSSVKFSGDLATIFPKYIGSFTSFLDEADAITQLTTRKDASIRSMLTYWNIQQQSFADVSPRFRSLFVDASGVFCRFRAPGPPGDPADRACAGVTPESNTITTTITQTNRLLKNIDSDFEDIRQFTVRGGRGLGALNDEYPKLVNSYAPLQSALTTLNTTKAGTKPNGQPDNNLITFQGRTLSGLPAFVRWFGELWAGIVTVGRDANGAVGYQFVKNIECLTGVNQQDQADPINCGVRGDNELASPAYAKPGYPDQANNGDTVNNDGGPAAP